MSATVPDRIPSLDGFRGVAILIIVSAHLLYQRYIPVPSRVTDVIMRNRLGVTLFFVLSGFLITTLLLKELERKGRINLGRFYWRRAWRILPAYVTFVFVLGLLNALQLVPLNDNELWHALTLTTNLSEVPWYSGHTWSTSTQEQFYLFWPSVILLLGRRQGLYAALAVMLLCPVIRFSIWMIEPGFYKATFFYPHMIIDAIATGAALACARPWLQRQGFYQRLLGSRLFLLVPPALLLGCLMIVKPHLNAVFGIGIRNLGMALCLDWAMTNDKGWAGRLLNSRPLVFLGTISFSVYLWQQLFISPHPAAQAPYNLLALGLVAVASYYLIEQPAVTAGRSLERRFAAEPSSRGNDRRTPQSAPSMSLEQNRPADAL